MRTIRELFVHDSHESFFSSLHRVAGRRCLALCTCGEPPYQGVFTMSNNDQNEIGVNRIKDDGGLEWVGAFFETGGIGLGFPANDVGC